MDLWVWGELPDHELYLVSNTLMANLNREDECTLDTDASSWAIGAVLSQMQTDHTSTEYRERVVAYGSQCMLPAELNYSELLAIIFV